MEQKKEDRFTALYKDKYIDWTDWPYVYENEDIETFEKIIKNMSFENLEESYRGSFVCSNDTAKKFMMIGMELISRKHKRKIKERENKIYELLKELMSNSLTDEEVNEKIVEIEKLKKKSVQLKITKNGKSITI